MFFITMVTVLLMLLGQVPDTTVSAPDFIPAMHPLAWVWAFLVSGLATLLYEGAQRYSMFLNNMSPWPKRGISIAVAWLLALIFAKAGIQYPTDPLSWNGVGFIGVVNGLMGWGAHSLLFSKGK